MDATTIEWGGLTLGRPSAYRVLRLDGWEDLPGLDSGDEPRPARHGSWPGTSYAQARTVTAELLLRTSRAEVLDRVRDLRRALAVADDATLAPLTVSVLGERLTADARVSQRIMPLDRHARLGHVRAVVQWVAPDPARYEPDPVHLVIPPGESRTAPHHGTTGTRPVITVYGPCSSPTIRLEGTPDITLAFDTPILDGEALVVDCHTGTALLDGVDWSETLAVGSVPVEYFTIPSGQRPIHFEVSSSSGTARAHVVYRHAYL